VPPIELTIDVHGPLRFILDLGAAVVAALVGGSIAVRLRQPAVVGYILAGVVIGPFTPGFVGDVEEIAVLAEVGIVLLLFALGVQFSIRELSRVRRVAIPGAIAQVVGTAGVGAVAAVGLGLEPRAALVLGACLSISSTIVVLKLLIERGELDSLHGRTAIGWMIVQDIATIVFIVSLPPLAGADPVAPLLGALASAAIFLGLAYVVGTRLLPWVFNAIAGLRSQELFLLTVVGTALATAFVSSAVFGLSLALGAFVAGLLVSESEVSYQAAAEVIPFRDLFAVLFFVSVGMLVDPAALVAQAPTVALLVVIAVVVKGAMSAGLARALGLPARSALLLGGLVANVGEFSFILAQNALDEGLFDAEAYNLVLGTAVLTIILSPFLVRGSALLARRWEARVVAGSLREPAGTTVPTTSVTLVPAAAGPHDPPVPGAAPDSRGERVHNEPPSTGRAPVVVLGAGRVGRVVIRAVRNRGLRCIVIDRDQRRLEEVAKLGAATLYGDAASPEILARAELDRARVLVVAVGDPLTTRLAVERARSLNPQLQISARARGRREIDQLGLVGVRRVADPEAEVAFELTRQALQRMGVSGPELSGILVGLRRDVYGQ
jgi:CPA2 family monovalent cation:H+ antiporter-2